jgi:hypothetical protein
MVSNIAERRRMPEQTGRTPLKLGERHEPAGGWPKNADVFTAPESLLVFPLGTSVVATAARAARTIGGADSESSVVPLIAALLVGAVILGLTVLDDAARPRTPKAWVVSICVATVNSLVLFTAALGIEKF